MQALCLASYNIKRIFRHRPLWVLLLAVPLAAAVVRCAFWSSPAVLWAAYVCPPVCALLTWSVLYMQRAIDGESGLLAGIASSPLSESALLGSRLLAGALIFGMQMAVFALILAIRF